MLTESGHFNRAWLNSRSTAELRYEAGCERIRNSFHLPRHTLLLILGQLKIVE